MYLKESPEGVFTMCAFTKECHKVAKALMSGFETFAKALSPLIDSNQDGDENRTPSMCMKYVGNGFYRVYTFTERQNLVARALCGASFVFNTTLVPISGEVGPDGKFIAYCKESDACAEDPSQFEGDSSV